jgi:DNA polymerase-3 subunit delta'
MSASPIESTIPGLEHHPHAQMVIGAGLRRREFSHAYLFHGPPGTGKAAAARALAAELLAEDDPAPENVRHRVEIGAHPDMTWVRPSGAHVMRVDDVDGPVVSAASRTPFEARRRVFVLERVDTMNDEVANRMLKTLEEPASFVHLILLTDSVGRVLETVVSRCQLVRFDPVSPARIATVLEREGIPAERAEACGRLSLGNVRRARLLASEEGLVIRSDAERLVRDALAGDSDGTEDEPWRPLLDRAEDRRVAVEQEAEREIERRLEVEPKGRDRRALERELTDAAKRDGRRARTEVLELGLELAAVAFRDLACAAEGATAAVLGSDRIAELGSAASGRDGRRLREAVERCDDTRQSLQLNVTEELALSALTFRLRRLVGTG